MKISTANYVGLFTKLLLPFIFIVAIASKGFSQNGVAINTTGNPANGSAMLDITSTTRGLLIPRMTQSERNSIPVSASTDGLIVYQTDNQYGFYYYSAFTSSWSLISPASGNGNYIFNQIAQQPSSNFNISGAGVIGTTFNVGGLSTLTGVTNTGALTSSGGVISLNNNSNFAANINTGTSTGNVTIGNSSSNLFLPKFNTAGRILYSSTAGGQIDATAAGIATTILHGGATPSFSAVSLIADVTGILPIANGGTGVSNTAPALSVFGNSANAVVAPAFITGGTAGKYLGVRTTAGVTTLGFYGINATDVSNTGIVTTTGNASATQVAFWKTNTSLSGNSNLYWDSVNFRLGIGTSSPGSTLTNNGTLASSNGAISLNANSNFNTIINENSAAAVNIGTGTSTGTVTIGGINASGSQNILIGASAAGTGVSTVTIGSTVNASTTNIKSGSGSVNINKDNGSQQTFINTGTSTGTVTIGGTGSQAISIGSSITNGTITLGNSANDPVTTNILAGIGGGVNINNNVSKNLPTNINTGATTGNVTIGSTNNNLILPKFNTASNTGNILYTNLGTVSGTGTGSNGNVLTLNAVGSPVWQPPATNGTVTSVTASLPLSSSGGTTPNISLTGIVPIANGGTFSSIPLSGSSIMVSNGTSIVQGDKGTSTTVLHGNAAGTPTYSAVGLTTDVTGILPVANGGTGVATTSANFVFAGPNGSAGAPSFRALVAADLPSGSSNYIQNQNGLSQNAKYWINGPASIGTSTFVATNQFNVATSNSANNAIIGSNTASASTDVGDGVDGFTIQSKGVGVYGYNTNSSGTGIIGAGNNVFGGGYYLIAGSGGAFTGSTTGLYATYTSSGSPTQAIYTEDNVGNIVRVNYWSGTTQYKIFGAGTVSTVAENLDNKSKVVLHAPEAPEILFEDYGQGKLVNGKAHIDIDPIFSKNVAINDKHPLRVFIQLEGDCNGVYVTNKSKTGFDVVELQKGNSNVSFQWHIVCNRANETLANGKISRNEDMRFEPALEENQSLKANDRQQKKSFK